MIPGPDTKFPGIFQSPDVHSRWDDFRTASAPLKRKQRKWKLKNQIIKINERHYLCWRRRFMWVSKCNYNCADKSLIAQSRLSLTTINNLRFNGKDFNYAICDLLLTICKLEGLIVNDVKVKTTTKQQFYWFFNLKFWYFFYLKKPARIFIIYGWSQGPSK